MSTPAVGLVGRHVSVEVKRGEVTEPEVCEVMACEYAAGYSWRILVATRDGGLLSVEPGGMILVQSPTTSGGPFR